MTIPHASESVEDKSSPTICGAFRWHKTPRTHTTFTVLLMAGGSKSATKLERE